MTGLLNVISSLLLLIIVSLLTQSSSSSSNNGNKENESSSSWQWIPEAEHPCTIPRYTEEELKRIYPNGLLPPLYSKPLIITRKNSTNENFRQMTTYNSILEYFGNDFQITLSSSNAFSEHRKQTTLYEYLYNITTIHPITTPDQLSNETWYLFGETYTNEWQKLLQYYVVPPCETCYITEYIALSFGIGNRGSGVQWHIHGPGFSEAIHGRKHWVLYPPKYTIPGYHKDHSSRQWMEYIYTKEEQKNDKVLLQECTLNIGDIIYFPDQWWHATINLDPYTVFISTFTSEHEHIKQMKQYNNNNNNNGNSLLLSDNNEL